MNNTIVRMIFGSHLYGTDTPDSDRDYKGVYMPERNDILLGRIPKHRNVRTKRGSDTKNTPQDIDTEFYSLHYFLELGKAGETGILDMLHAPPDMILETSDIWEAIVANRHRFYTRTLKALVGYARRQAAKYGIKGSRLNDVKRVLVFLTAKDHNDKLSKHWDRLPEGEHIHKLPSDDERFRFYQVAGRKYLETVKVSAVTESLSLVLQQYGNRAIDAARNIGIDWKALSHAIRAAMEVKEILEHQTITFPLAEAEYLKQVKLGKLDYKTEVAPKLEGLMDEVELLAEKSDLPQTVDGKFWDEFIVEVLNDRYWRQYPPVEFQNPMWWR